MKQDLLALLAQQLAPLIAQELLRQPRYYGGGPEKVICGKGVKLINTFFNVNSGCVTIGDDSFFGHDVMCLTGSHDTSRFGKERRRFGRAGSDIKIGSGVWIASRAIILGPCVIGDNAVIAAGSVVLPGEYEANCLYAGTPAVLKKRL
jgi:acetyltransferase-like isoleucine patch superfamily enzyme